MKDRLAEGKPAEVQTNFRAYVGNLPFGIQDHELKELFERYGTVSNVYAPVDESAKPIPNPFQPQSASSNRSGSS